MKKIGMFLFVITIVLLIGKEVVYAEVLKGLVEAKNNQGEQITRGNAKWHLESIGVNEFREEGIYGANVKIAILEGSAGSHKDLQSKNLYFISCGIKNGKGVNSKDCLWEKGPETEHATDSVGIILSTDYGVAPRSVVYSVNYLNENGQLELKNFKRSLKWAIDNEVDIISMSTAFTKEQIEESIDEDGNLVDMGQTFLEFKKDVDSLIEEAYEKDILILASSGNGNAPEILYPSSNEKVISVGVVEEKDGTFNRTISNYQKGLYFVAPGENITVPRGEDGYGKTSGTSISTPMTAGYLSLLKDFYNKNGEPKTNYEILDIAKKIAISMTDKNYEYEENFSEGYYYNSGYGYGMIHGIPEEGKVKVDTKTAFRKYPSEQAESVGKISDIVLDESIEIPYYKKWNNWYKVNNGKGEKVWINIKEGITSEQNPTTQLPSKIHSFNGYEDFMNSDGTYTGYISGGQWVQETKFKNLSYEELDNNYTYHPQEEVYKYYGMMASGDFYDKSELYEDRLAYQRKVYQQEELLYPGMNPWDNSEYYAQRHYYEGDISPYRIDYMNIYNLVLENPKGETYFVPVFSPARFTFDINEQFFGPKTNDYVLPDGRISRYITAYALIPSNDFSIFNFREIRGAAQLSIGTMTYDQLGKTNILPILETKLGEQNLKLVDVIYDAPKEKEEISKKTKVWEMIESYDNYNHQTAYENKEGKDRFMDNRRWIQETEFTDIPYEEIEVNYTFHPTKSAYNLLKSRFNGDFYDKNTTTEHFLKDKVSDFRLDKNNQYYLIFKNPSGQTYFLPIWTTALLDFDLKKQTIKPITSDYIHSNGYGGVYFRVYGLKKDSYTSYFNEKEQNGDLLISSYLGGKVVTDINSIDIMEHIKKRINMSDGELVQVIGK